MKKLIVLGLSASLLVACGPIKGGNNNNDDNGGGDTLTYDTPTPMVSICSLVIRLDQTISVGSSPL